MPFHSTCCGRHRPLRVETSRRGCILIISLLEISQRPQTRLRQLLTILQKSVLQHRQCTLIVQEINRKNELRPISSRLQNCESPGFRLKITLTTSGHVHLLQH